MELFGQNIGSSCWNIRHERSDRHDSFSIRLRCHGRQWHSAGLSMFRGLLAKVGVLARWYIGRVDNTYSQLLDNTPPFRTRFRVLVLKVTTTTSSPPAAKYIRQFKESSRVMNGAHKRFIILIIRYKHKSTINDKFILAQKCDNLFYIECATYTAISYEEFFEIFNLNMQYKFCCRLRDYKFLFFPRRALLARTRL